MKLSPLSDRTLVEHFERRLRELGVFQLYTRKLGPRDHVYVTMDGFTLDGAQYRVVGHAFDLRDALLGALSTAKSAHAGELRTLVEGFAIDRKQVRRCNVARFDALDAAARSAALRALGVPLSAQALKHQPEELDQ